MFNVMAGGNYLPTTPMSSRSWHHMNADSYGVASHNMIYPSVQYSSPTARSSTYRFPRQSTPSPAGPNAEVFMDHTNLPRDSTTGFQTNDPDNTEKLHRLIYTLHCELQRLKRITTKLDVSSNDPWRRDIKTLAPRIHVSLNDADYILLKSKPCKDIVESLRSVNESIQAAHVRDRNPKKRELVIGLSDWSEHARLLNHRDFQDLRTALGIDREARVSADICWMLLEDWNPSVKSTLVNIKDNEDLRKEWSTRNNLDIKRIDFRGGNLLWGFATPQEAAEAFSRPLYFEGVEAAATPIDITAIPVFCRRCGRPAHMAGECSSIHAARNGELWPCLRCAKNHRRKGERESCTARRCCINCLRNNPHKADGHSVGDSNCPDMETRNHLALCRNRSAVKPEWTHRTIWPSAEESREKMNGPQMKGTVTKRKKNGTRKQKTSVVTDPYPNIVDRSGSPFPAERPKQPAPAGCEPSVVDVEAGDDASPSTPAVVNGPSEAPKRKPGRPRTKPRPNTRDTTTNEASASNPNAREQGDQDETIPSSNDTTTTSDGVEQDEAHQTQLQAARNKAPRAVAKPRKKKAQEAAQMDGQDAGKEAGQEAMIGRGRKRKQPAEESVTQQAPKKQQREAAKVAGQEAAKMARIEAEIERGRKRKQPVEEAVTQQAPRKPQRKAATAQKGQGSVHVIAKDVQRGRPHPSNTTPDIESEGQQAQERTQETQEEAIASQEVPAGRRPKPTKKYLESQETLRKPKRKRVS